MVNVDEAFAAGGRADAAQALEGGAIGANEQIEVSRAGGFLQEVIGVQKGVLLRHGVLVPAEDVLAQFAQGQAQADLGADAIAIGADVAGDAYGLALTDGFNDAVNDFGMRFHASGEDFSNSSMMRRILSPRSMDLSRTKRRWGVYLRMTALPK